MLNTTQGGILGDPRYATSSTNPTADVFPNVTGIPTSTTPASSEGTAQLGNGTWLLDMTFVQFLQAQTIIAQSAACKIFNPWLLKYQVVATAAVGDLVMAVNDRSGQGLVANNCTWFTRSGLAFPLTAATTAAGAIVAASPTAGRLYAATVGTDGQWAMENSVLVGGSAAASPVFMVTA